MTMDPWIQRMLERAKVRGEKLNMQLSNAGHDVKRHRSPLKDANTILAQATANRNKSPTKSPSKASTEEINERSPIKNVSPKISNAEREEQVDKENGEVGLINVKTKLQRLGKLYSDDSNRELSSPIHRTEEKFYAEENLTEHKSAKKGARLDRLAALASTINNWEDDLSHPTITKTKSNKTDNVQVKSNEQIKKSTEPQPSTSGYNKSRNSNNNDENRSGQLKWDKTVLESLEAQGFNRTKSNSRLVYDYEHTQETKTATNSSYSPSKRSSNSKQSTSKPEIIEESRKIKENNVNTSPTKAVASATNKNLTTPEKVGRNANSSNNSKLTTRFGYNGSPKSPIQSTGSVLSKASMFELKSNDTKPKDPAQMSLSERKALFERNKGEAPLLPKAPLTMSIPPKKLHEKDVQGSASGHSTDATANARSKNDTHNKVVAQCAMFEQGHTQELENNILRSAHLERQRELEMLRSRFNTNKEIAQVAAGSCIRTSESSEGKPNSPKNSPVCPVKPTPAPDNTVMTQPPPPPPPLPFPQVQSPNCKSTLQQDKPSPIKRQVVDNSQRVQSTVQLPDVKRIRVSPPKPGKLYPNLSEIESTTDTESTTEYTVDSTEPATATLDENSEIETMTEAEYCIQGDESDLDSEEEIEEGNTSFGTSILRAVNQQAILKKKRSIEPDPDSSTTSDISVLDEMDEYLDECLAAQERNAKNRQEGPTPPKLNKGGKSPSTASTSFKYSNGSQFRSPVKLMSPTRKEEQYIVEDGNRTPLMHSVSLYRRQQSQLRTPKSPTRTTPKTTMLGILDSSLPNKDEAALVQEKVKRLLDEVCKQQTIIGQASQALNLCSSTVEFNGSQEQVEGERLLLVATHRRQAALNEVQRLKVEGSLRPVVPGSSELQDSGSLTVSAITLPLKKEYLRSMDMTTCLHFVCLMRHLEEVISTPVVVVEPGDSCIRFPSTLKLQDLYSDFKITVEIYSLQTQAEMLPHEVKYHIHNGSGNNCSGNKKVAGKTPKKLLKQENRLVMPSVQSPAGPTAVRSPAFQLSGYVIFSLKEIHRQQFTLNKVPPQSPLEGRLQMHVSCEPLIMVEHRNFLTMFEYVSGFGIWKRRWCRLKGTIISYWEYPYHEENKTPLGSLDLRGVSTINVGLAPLNICMRPNTLLLETKRAAQSEDVDSLIMVTNGSETTIRHLLSADTKEERLEWCSKLNKTLHLIRSWGGSSESS